MDAQKSAEHLGSERVNLKSHGSCINMLWNKACRRIIKRITYSSCQSCLLQLSWHEAWSRHDGPPSDEIGSSGSIESAKSNVRPESPMRSEM